MKERWQDAVTPPGAGRTDGHERREAPSAAAPPPAAGLSIASTAACAHRCAPATRRAGLVQAGLTLIEVLIVLVIVAILAVVAYPSYEDHLRKGRRAAAQSFLMEVATREQQYLLDARGYAVGAGALGSLNLAVPQAVARFYTVRIDPAAPTVPPSFVVVATPNAGSPQAPDGELTLDHQGAKSRNGQPGW